MKPITPSLLEIKYSILRGRSQEHGIASLLLVSTIMMSILMAVAISNWVMVQRRGDMQMRVAMKEMALAQSAIQETRLRLLDGAIPLRLENGTPQTFVYTVDSSNPHDPGYSTLNVRIEYQSFP